MTEKCPDCGRIHPGYARECKCGHKFVAASDRVEREGERVAIAGRALKCPHCGNDCFTGRKALLNTAGMTFFDFEWLNPSAEVFVCTQCGRLEWFLVPDLSVLDDDQA